MQQQRMIQRIIAGALCAAIAFPVLAFAEASSDAAVMSVLKPVAPSAQEAKPLEVGAMVPSVKVGTLDGKTATLAEATGGNPAVLVFYRGGWCPFCNRHLASLKDAQAPLKEMGYSLIAISPDTADDLKKTMAKQELDYTLLSDSKMDAARAFGVAFQVDLETVEKYKGHGINLDRGEGKGDNWLPVPSVFIVNAAGKVVYAYSNPDYKVRLDNAALLEAAKKAAMDS